MVEEGEVQQSSYAVKRVGRAAQVKIQCFTDPCSWNVPQKVINNNEVPDRVKCLSGTALNHQRKTSLEAKVFVLLNSMEGDIVHVVDHTQQTVRESNKSSTQQKDEMIFIQTHLMITIGLCTRVAKSFVSKTDGNGRTPSHDHSHDAMDHGVDKLSRVEKLTKECDFRACNSWNDCVILKVQETNHDDHSTQQDEREDGSCTC